MDRFQCALSSSDALRVFGIVRIEGIEGDMSRIARIARIAATIRRHAFPGGAQTLAAAPYTVGSSSLRLSKHLFSLPRWDQVVKPWLIVDPHHLLGLHVFPLRC